MDGGGMRQIRKMAGKVVPVLIGLMCFPAPAALTPAPIDRPKLGILRVGELHSAEEERAYDILEKRVQLWLENLSAPRPLVQSLGLSLRAEALQDQTEEQELARLSNEVLGSRDSLASPVASVEIARLRKQRQRLGRLGPVVQRAWLAEASLQLAEGKRTLAMSSLRSGLAMHPDAASPDFSQWDDDPTGGLLRLETLLSEARSDLVRLCEVELLSFPAYASLSVNGFVQGGRRKFHLPPGEFEFQFQAPGFNTKSERITCVRTTRFQRTVQLKKADDSPKSYLSELEGVRQRNAMGSLFLIQPSDGIFRFFLLSSEGRMDPIPMSRPLKISEVVNQENASLPIARDEMKTLIQRHSLNRADLSLSALASDGMAFDTASGALAERVGGPDRWYNDWKVWAVVGGIAAGMVGTYLMTRGPEIRTKAGAQSRWE